VQRMAGEVASVFEATGHHAALARSA
jgi:hypothetical protein